MTEYRKLDAFQMYIVRPYVPYSSSVIIFISSAKRWWEGDLSLSLSLIYAFLPEQANLFCESSMIGEERYLSIYNIRYRSSSWFETTDGEEPFKDCARTYVIVSTYDPLASSHG